jgi:hypothetical protein
MIFIACTQSMRNSLSLLTLKNRRRFLRFQLLFKIINEINCSEHLSGYFELRRNLRNRDFRDDTLLNVHLMKKQIGQQAFSCAVAMDWNTLPKA